MTLTLSSDITGTLTPNGGNSVFSTTRVGQNARYTFSGTASQAYTLHWSGATFAGNYSRFYVYRPNGTQLTSTNFNGAGSSSGSLNLGSLATTGTYTIVVNPYGSSTGQVTVWLTSP
jgi:hypothetical protein